MGFLHHGGVTNHSSSDIIKFNFWCWKLDFQLFLGGRDFDQNLAYDHYIDASAQKEVPKWLCNTSKHFQMGYLHPRCVTNHYSNDIIKFNFWPWKLFFQYFDKPKFQIQDSLREHKYAIFSRYSKNKVQNCEF